VGGLPDDPCSELWGKAEGLGFNIPVTLETGTSAISRRTYTLLIPRQDIYGKGKVEIRDSRDRR
jgi:hypothetical protein